ncbi:MAG: B12-binding domain-containing radical SAM protein [Rhodospirillales bacterium]|nr:B12-binding domain-containing radical SAM protein [Rhodospirillales bacterium]
MRLRQARKIRHVALVRGAIFSTSRSINNEATPSIAFAYIAAYLINRGYKVTIVDGVAEGLNQVWHPENYTGFQCQGLAPDEIIKRIPKDADVIGFSTMFSGEWPVIRDLINSVQLSFPDALIVAGGEHITALSEYSLRDCPSLDLCVRGEGEHTFFEVLEAFEEDGDFSKIGGVAYLDEDGQFQCSGDLPRIRQGGDISWPYWPEGYLEKFWAAGKSYGVQSKRDMPMLLSRGCPYQCTFCSSANMWTTRYILRDADDIVAEVKSYIKRYDITAVQLYDLTAITKKNWTKNFINKILSNNIAINWSLPSGTRGEVLDDEILGLLKKMGCNYLVYAPESGSEETLAKIKKRITLEKITKSVLTAKENGLVVRTNLIIGFPHELRRHVFKTIRYGLKLAAKGVDEVSINIFSPYPGTEIFGQLMASERIQLGDDYFLSLTSLNSDYTVTNPLTVNDNIGPRELAFYRIAFMLANYGLGYLFFPSRIVRTLTNIFSDKGTTTVLEHRLKDLLQRKRKSSAI